MWFGQTDASALCSLIPGCASVTKSGKGYRMRLVGYAPALGEVQQDVDMNVVKEGGTASDPDAVVREVRTRFDVWSRGPETGRRRVPCHSERGPRQGAREFSAM